MKQAITEEQYNELTVEGKERLRQFLNPGVKRVPEYDDRVYWYPNIGQLIEFLDEHDIDYNKPLVISKELDWNQDGAPVDSGFTVRMEDTSKTEEELIDALWSAATEILNA